MIPLVFFGPFAEPPGMIQLLPADQRRRRAFAGAGAVVRSRNKFTATDKVALSESEIVLLINSSTASGTVNLAVEADNAMTAAAQPDEIVAANDSVDATALDPVPDGHRGKLLLFLASLPPLPDEGEGSDPEPLY